LLTRAPELLLASDQTVLVVLKIPDGKPKTSSSSKIIDEDKNTDSLYNNNNNNYDTLGDKNTDIDNLDDRTKKVQQI
jgi:hypothetical protein